MYGFGFISLLAMMVSRLAGAEFYSDVDSTEHDHRKALEIKAKDFWSSMMRSAQYLETTANAKLSAKVDRALKKLPEEDSDIRELFHEAMGHLAQADAMLFEEATKFKELARSRLEHGPPREALLDTTSEFENVFYSAYKRFVGGQSTYQKRLGKHIIARIKDIKPAMHSAPEIGPQMLAESGKASDKAYAITRLRESGSKGHLPLHLRKLSYEIISATGKQRLRFTDYLLNSLMTTAEDIAGESEPAAKTLMRSSLRGIESEAVKKDAGINIARKEEVKIESPESPEAKLIFYDGVPIDAKPLADYTSSAEQLFGF